MERNLWENALPGLCDDRKSTALSTGESEIIAHSINRMIIRINALLKAELIQEVHGCWKINMAENPEQDLFHFAPETNRNLFLIYTLKRT